MRWNSERLSVKFEFAQNINIRAQVSLLTVCVCVTVLLSLPAAYLCELQTA